MNEKRNEDKKVFSQLDEKISNMNMERDNLKSDIADQKNFNLEIKNQIQDL